MNVPGKSKAAVNTGEIVGAVCNHRADDPGTPDEDEEDTYKFKRWCSSRMWRVARDTATANTATVKKISSFDRDYEPDDSLPEVPDETASPATHKVYDADNPRIDLGYTHIKDVNKTPVGSAVICKHSFYQKLRRTRDEDTTVAAQMLWMSTITIRRTGPGTTDWTRVSTNFIKEGSQALTISQKEAQDAVAAGITVNLIDPNVVNKPDLYQPSIP